jgi:integrase
MPHYKLTQKTVERLPAPTPTGKPVLWWDVSLPGFAVLCSGTTNAKSFVVQRRGKRRAFASVHEMPLADAREMARNLLLDLRRGIDPTKQKKAATLQEILEAFLAAKKDISHNTRTLYGQHVRNHLSSWLDRPLVSITPAEVDAMHAAIARKVAQRGRNSGHTTANDVIGVLRTLHNWAANRDDSLPRNPVRIRGDEWFALAPKRNPIPAEKLAAWYAAVMALPSDIGRDYLLLLLFTGLRRRELSHLTWDQVDFAQRAIRLPMTKNRRPFVLPMSSHVRAVLVARRQLGDAHFVFPSNFAASGHIEGAVPWVAMVAAETGIVFTLHDLRRTFASTAEACDLSWSAVKGLLNHTLGSGVTESYINQTCERLRDPMQKVCDRLLALCGVAVPSDAKVAKI